MYSFSTFITVVIISGIIGVILGLIGKSFEKEDEE